MGTGKSIQDTKRKRAMAKQVRVELTSGFRCCYYNYGNYRSHPIIPAKNSLKAQITEPVWNLRLSIIDGL